MNRIEVLKESFFNYIKKYYPTTEEILKSISFELNVDPQKKEFGDVSSNAALLLSKKIGKNPREIAQDIAYNFVDTAVHKMEVAGPGFINFFLTEDFFNMLAQDIFIHPANFFKSGPDAKLLNYSIEFVSANPTGPLHLGHGRGGIIGDVLGNILKFLKNEALKEFYINDAGKQIEKLGISLKIRCEQQLGRPIEMPEDAYQGGYLIDLARIYLDEFSNEAVNQPIEIFAAYAKKHLLHDIKKTMQEYGIEFDVWFSEKTLHKSGSIEQALQIIENKGFTYIKENALWFKSSEFGDDKDRVLKRANGEYTYIAADMAYLQNKLNRGFDKIIMILGQDHHSYVHRLKAMMQAFGKDPERLHVILYQLVTIKEDGELQRMSKRAGMYVTLQNIIDTVGKDVARFFYLHRKAEAHLDFDLSLALKKTDENPVYYIQYAYVRTNSILRKANVEPELENITQKDLINLDTGEHDLIKKVAQLRELLHNIADHYQTHLLTYYVIELAREFHSYYNKHKVVDLESVQKSRSRLAVVQIINNTLKLCLELLGLETPEKM